MAGQITRFDVVNAQFCAAVERLKKLPKGSKEYQALIATCGALYAEYKLFATRPEYV